MNNQGTLIIRADAGSEIGSGHVMRCIALAEAWQASGGNVHFVLATAAPKLEERISREGFKVIHLSQTPGSPGDANETLHIANRANAEWVVVDGYHFGGEYQKIIKKTGFSLLVIDDFGHADHYYADIVLNQNIYANMSLYPKHESSTRFLLGIKYALLRREFLQWAGGYNRTIPKVARKLLVTLGGSDPDNVTGTVIEALKRSNIKGLEVIVVAGGLNCHVALLQEMICGYPNFSIRSNAENMPELMAWADMAISAGGTTCWELAFMGVPSIICAIAENQEPTANYLFKKKISAVLELPTVDDDKIMAKKIEDLLLSEKKRNSFSKEMKKHVDGKGSRLTILAMLSQHFQLRQVHASDCTIVWNWINDPDVRYQSFSSQKISLSEHKKWFASALKNPQLIYYIAIDDQDHPFGQVRFLIEGNEAVISVMLDKEHRGLHLGSRLIISATEKFFKETNIQIVNAYIKTENEYSFKSFKKADYLESGALKISGQMAYHLKKIGGPS